MRTRFVADAGLKFPGSGPRSIVAVRFASAVPIFVTRAIMKRWIPTANLSAELLLGLE